MMSERLIETDAFPFEFLSELAERESWRKEIHRPIYHIHKWWAKRLGSVFRGILVGAVLPRDTNLKAEFYRRHNFNDFRVFDPFMGSGTTVGEAHKLGLTAIGRDINAVAVESVRTALGPMDPDALKRAFRALNEDVGESIRALYHSLDSKGRPCDVLYFFWVMRAPCSNCHKLTDLFPSRIVARHAYPDRKHEIQVVCPCCGGVFAGLNTQQEVECPSCSTRFDPSQGNAKGIKAVCTNCEHTFGILPAIAASGQRPEFRLYAKLVLTEHDRKEYLAATDEDHEDYRRCSELLRKLTDQGELALPSLSLERGFNTRQAMNYHFCNWRDFFNDRQLLALGLLRRAITELEDKKARQVMLTLFSGVLEFNNLFASYKGEGTGAVRHMFSHHILKPERTPIEPNVWGTPKSSGSFSSLFRSRMLRAIDYRMAPTEVNGRANGKSRQCSPPFTGKVELDWPVSGRFADRGIYLSSGDSADTSLPDHSIDLVVTDPPFFDNVHYSELADFFYAWQRLDREDRSGPTTTRSLSEVQDTDAKRFAAKLKAVLSECQRLLKTDGLLVFTYHHSRDAGWRALAEAVLGAGFTFINSHPVKAEMSVATPKSQAKEPIQLDIILVCRKAKTARASRPTAEQAKTVAAEKIGRLRQAGFKLSANDRKIVVLGQLLTSVHHPDDIDQFVVYNEIEADDEEDQSSLPSSESPRQGMLF